MLVCKFATNEKCETIAPHEGVKLPLLTTKKSNLDLVTLLTCACYLIISILCCESVAAGNNATSFPSLYDSKSAFIEAINKERLREKPNQQLTGITVPHHMLAADLIARGFWAASSTKVRRVIILSPDHFRLSRRSFATTTKSFQTIFGSVEGDRVAVRSLLGQSDLFEESELFAREHGVGAITPFVAYFFRGAKVVPIAISVDTVPDDWERAVQALMPLVGEGTLIVQSTDFSHYLSLAKAEQRDQETLNALGVAQAERISSLKQSDHLDSKAAQYIQMRLQTLSGAVGPIIVGNRNSVEYGGPTSLTTSYVVQLYGTNLEAAQIPKYSDQAVVYFGGDVLLGRYLTPYLLQRQVRDELLGRLEKITGGNPLIINLEGLLLEEVPVGLKGDEHIGHASLASLLLPQMHVVGATLANNHAFDLGELGLEETAKLLSSLGIKPIRQGEIADFGAFRLVALNFISKRQIKDFPITDETTFKQLCKSEVRPPLFAFVHWGEEYTASLSESERQIAVQLQDCGVGGVFGAHSHRASRMQTSRDGSQQIVFSLGNLLFDQGSSKASSALLEVRIFRQGTFAARLIDIPNLFDLSRGLH